MAKEVIETAVREGIPFGIRKADGHEHIVHLDRDVHFGRIHVLVIDHNALPHILPLLTITGRNYLQKPENGHGG